VARQEGHTYFVCVCEWGGACVCVCVCVCVCKPKVIGFCFSKEWVGKVPDKRVSSLLGDLAQSER